jgi:hypothetical protein
MIFLVLLERDSAWKVRTATFFSLAFLTRLLVGAYLFHFKSSRMHNTDEFVNGVQPFQEALSDVPCTDLPVFARLLKNSQVTE